MGVEDHRKEASCVFAPIYSTTGCEGSQAGEEIVSSDPGMQSVHVRSREEEQRKVSESRE